MNDLVGIVKFLHGKNGKNKFHLQGAAATARYGHLKWHLISSFWHTCLLLLQLQVLLLQLSDLLAVICPQI
jgi:hypothetical protein